MAMQRQGSNGGFRRRKKVCYFCENKIEHIDYKDTKVIFSINLKTNYYLLITIH